jgi:type I restriction enzyme M protein
MPAKRKASSETSSTATIGFEAKLIEADLVDCMVTLPGQLFYTTPIAVCLWYLAKNKRPAKMHDRRKTTLFIDARALGE